MILCKPQERRINAIVVERGKIGDLRTRGPARCIFRWKGKGKFELTTDFYKV